MTLVGLKIPTSCKTECPTGFYSRFWDSCGFMAVHFAQQPFLIAISFWETWRLVLCLYRSMFVDLTRFNQHHSVRVTNGNLSYRCNYSACSVMVSDSESGIFELSTNSVLFYCLHFCKSAREKSMKPSSPRQLWVKQRGKLARFALGSSLWRERINLNSKLWNEKALYSVSREVMAIHRQRSGIYEQCSFSTPWRDMSLKKKTISLSKCLFPFAHFQCIFCSLHKTLVS